jgi:hypothetical protein
VDHCDRGWELHRTRVTLNTRGGDPSGGECQADDGGGFRYCCRDAFPLPAGCLAPACPVPHGARGPVILGARADHELIGCDAAETLWSRAEAVELRCGQCPCSATATMVTCDGETTSTCEVNPGSPDCTTGCTGRRAGASHSVAIEGDGIAPEISGGRCVVQGTLTMCDPLGAL